MKLSHTLFLICLLNEFANHRTFAGFANGQACDVIIGEQRLPATAGLFCQGVAVDWITHKVFLVDSSANRILRFSSTAATTNGSAAEAVFGQPDFTSSAAATTAAGLKNPVRAFMDVADHLWVVDKGNNRILRFDNATTKPSGAAADGVLGQPNFTSAGVGLSSSALSQPEGLACDRSGRLWVADTGNRRVLRFTGAALKPNGSSADVVLGQPGFLTNTSSLTASGMSLPSAIGLEYPSNIASVVRIWVADRGYSRVLRFDSAEAKVNGAPANGVLGSATFTTAGSATTAAGFNQPSAVTSDTTGHLYVGDILQNRILRFDNAGNKANGANADAVLGNNGFTAAGDALPTAGHFSLADLAWDTANRLWVADDRNNRLLRFEAPALKVNGADADGVLGGGPEPALNPASVFNPMPAALSTGSAAGIAIDPVSGKLFAADQDAHRVLRFANTASLTSGAPAEAVFGQVDFLHYAAGLGAAGMTSPWGLACDAAGHLWVCDAGNNRVLRFDNASSAASGASAARVLGQPDFVTMTSGTAAAKFNSPAGLVLSAAGTLYIADQGNNRILRISAAASKNSGAPADGVVGQTNLTSSAATTTQGGLKAPKAVAVDSTGRLWVADTGNRRALRFPAASSAATGALADLVLGQADYTSALAALDASHFGPAALTLDALGHLWIGDRTRVIRFDLSVFTHNGDPADGVLGWTSPAILPPSSGLSNGSDRISQASGVAFDPTGHLWVCDLSAQRVIRFSHQSLAITSAGFSPAHEFQLTFTSAAGVHYDVESSPDMDALNWENALSLQAVSSTTQFTQPQDSAPRQFFRVREK